jgi:hypothetical protein
VSTQRQAANLARVKRQNPGWTIEEEDGGYVARRSWYGREQTVHGWLADLEIGIRSAAKGGPRRKAVTGPGPQEPVA